MLIVKIRGKERDKEKKLAVSVIALAASCHWAINKLSAFRLTPKPKSKPSAAGSIWKGGARERADDFIFSERIK